MNDAFTHYEKLLANSYSRVMGGFDAKTAESASFFEQRGLRPKGSGRAVDLGAGSGFQALALARAGFSVTAVDASPTLLEELAGRATGLDVTTVQADMRALSDILHEPVELAVCMGDTLSHLGTLEEVAAFLRNIHAALEPNGLAALSFRNQETPLTGPDRFLPVYAADDLLFTCALEYAEEHIEVTDLAWTREEEGWRLEKSSYRKVRLRRPAILELLEKAGFSLIFEETNRGMVWLVGKKRQAKA